MEQVCNTILDFLSSKYQNVSDILPWKYYFVSLEESCKIYPQTSLTKKTNWLRNKTCCFCLSDNKHTSLLHHFSQDTRISLVLWWLWISKSCRNVTSWFTNRQKEFWFNHLTALTAIETCQWFHRPLINPIPSSD